MGADKLCVFVFMGGGGRERDGKEMKVLWVMDEANWRALGDLEEEGRQCAHP